MHYRARRVRFVRRNHLSLHLPLSLAADQWIAEHVHADAQWLGNALVVEWRYEAELAAAMRKDGLILSEATRDMRDDSGRHFLLRVLEGLCQDLAKVDADSLGSGLDSLRRVDDVDLGDSGETSKAPQHASVADRIDTQPSTPSLGGRN